MPTREERAQTLLDERYVEAQAQIRRLEPVMALRETLTKRELLALAAAVIPAYVAGLPRLVAHWDALHAAKTQHEQAK